jgi:chain length determinant protein (polysaccharide antigen chain regulator)
MTEHNTDNIDNFLDVVMERKNIILGIIMVTILSSVIYAYSETEIFKTSIYIIPPQEGDVNALNIIDKDGKTLVNESRIRSHEVYSMFMVNSQSRKYQRDFFFNGGVFDRYIEEDPERYFEEFHKNLLFTIQSKTLSRDVRGESFLTVSFMHHDSNEAAKALNLYVNYVIRATSQELVNGANKLLSNKRDSVQSLVDSKINLARRITEDRIVQLEEALIIAKKLNIAEMQINTNQQSVIMSDDNVHNNSPLYLYGSKALEVEIQTLLERKSEESFVPGLRVLQQQVAALDIVKIDPEAVVAARIDQKALPMSQRHSPKRKLIVFLGAVLGVFFTLLYVFTITTFYRRKLG